jgi:5-methylcytosine-specific restriction endonuclease McrA
MTLRRFRWKHRARRGRYSDFTIRCVRSLYEDTPIPVRLIRDMTGVSNANVVQWWAQKYGWSRKALHLRPRKPPRYKTRRADQRCDRACAEGCGGFTTYEWRKRRRTDRCTTCFPAYNRAKASRWRGSRQDARKREYVARAERAGRQYRSRDEIRAAAEVRRQMLEVGKLARVPRKQVRGPLVARLQAEDPAYCATSSPKTIAWRARYLYDPDFRAKEIERMHRRRSKEHGVGMLSDGTLTGAVVRRLFGEASSCPYCGRRMQSCDKSMDHIWPRRLGGWHAAHNAVVCCKSCNARKSALPPTEWLARLKPEHRTAVERMYRTVAGASWYLPPLPAVA